MKRILVILLFIYPLFAKADFKIVATLTITNAPNTNGSTFTWNGDTRTGTNANTSTTFATNTTVGGITTNFWRHVIKYPFANQHYAEWISTNSIKIYAENNTTVTNEIVGNWAELTLVTNTIGGMRTNVAVPAINAYSQSDASNVLTQLVKDINEYNTNAFTNAHFYGDVLVTNGFLKVANDGASGVSFSDTNGLTWTITCSAEGLLVSNGSDKPFLISTNGLIQFAPLSTISQSTVFKINNQDGTTISTISTNGDLAITGNSTFGSISNGYFLGTNSWNGDLSFVWTNNTAQAAGNNAATDINKSVKIWLQGMGSSAFTTCGIAGGRDGRIVTLWNTNGAAWTIANQSGSDPSPENRIKTGTGGDVTITNNPGYAEFEYNGTESRWWLKDWSH